MAAKMAASTVVQRNLPYFRQQLFAFFQTCSVSVKLICAMVFLFYLLSFSESAFRAISCTPGFVIPPNFWVWTAFSHCFMENTLWMVLTDVITVGLCGKLIEPLWGAMEMMTFFAIVNTSVAFLSTMYYIVVYTVSSDPYYLFSIHIHGLAGYCAGVAVAVKQIMPDHMLLNLPIGKLRNRNVPLSVFVLSLVLWVVGLLRSTYPVMFATGLISSWVYLRFYQHHSNGTKGDMAENFTFASFLVFAANKILNFKVPTFRNGTEGIGVVYLQTMNGKSMYVWKRMSHLWKHHSTVVGAFYNFSMTVSNCIC